MKSKIVVFGFVLVSVFAVAQSSSNQADKKSSDDKQAREASTGKATGKMAQDKAEANSESLKTVSDVKTTGKTKPMASDDWQAKKVATGDVNGDGKTDATAASSSDVKAPRDIATGQASGKRQHQPVSLKKEDEQKPASDKK